MRIFRDDSRKINNLLEQGKFVLFNSPDGIQKLYVNHFSTRLEAEKARLDRYTEMVFENAEILCIEPIPVVLPPVYAYD